MKSGVIWLRNFVIFSSLIFSEGLLAGTSLTVDLEQCLRIEERQVICKFKIRSDRAGLMSLTGGQYSQAVDEFGNSYDASAVEVGDDSGMAVSFSVSRDGEWVSGVLSYDNVDPDIRDKAITIQSNF